jgi:hypothetical protein
MLRGIGAAVALIAMAACSGAEKPKSERELVAEAMQHADTKAAVAAFFDCLADVAPKTPNGKEALDLDRINRAIEACGPQEEAMKAQVNATWGKKTSQREMERRFKGLKEEAWKVIREHPYEPPVVSEPEPS